MKKQGYEVPFPGIDNSQGSRGPLTIKHTKYYQWVAFTLFFQVSGCYCSDFRFLSKDSNHRKIVCVEFTCRLTIFGCDFGKFFESGVDFDPNLVS